MGVEDEPPLAAALGANAAGARAHDRAALGSVERIGHDQSRVVAEAIGIFEPLIERGPQRQAGLVADKIERAAARQDLASAEPIIERKAEPDQKRRAPGRIERQDKAQRLDEMRRDPQQHFALAERRAHQPQRALLKIAQPAMDQLRGHRRCAGGEIVLLDKHDLKAAPGRIAGNARAVDAAADDGEIEIGH